MLQDKLKHKLIFSGLLIAPWVFLALPANFFDNGPAICPSKVFLNIECLGCGLTRATQHLIHADWQQAANYSKLSFITTPIICVVWLMELIKFYKKAFNK